MRWICPNITQAFLKQTTVKSFAEVRRCGKATGDVYADSSQECLNSDAIKNLDLFVRPISTNFNAIQYFGEKQMQLYFMDDHYEFQPKQQYAKLLLLVGYQGHNKFHNNFFRSGDEKTVVSTDIYASTFSTVD